MSCPVRRAFLGILLFAGGNIAACSASPMNADESTLYLEIHQDSPTCARVNGRSPESYLKDDFVAGVVNGRAHGVINITCLDKVFSTNELVSFAQKGDPVAELHQIASDFKSKKALCDSPNEAITRLKRIAEVRTNDDLANSAAFRLPEAYYLVSLVLDDCGLPGGEAAMMRSYRYGFDPSVVVNLVD